MRNKTAVDTTVLSDRQRLAHATAALGAVLRRVGRVHLDHFTASIRSFACEDHGELVPARVTDTFGEMMVFDHPAHVQIFDGDVIVRANHIKRRLVVKVCTLSFDVQMLPRQNIDGLPASVAALVLSARNGALCRLQFTFGGGVVFRVFNSMAVGQRGKALYAQINPCRLPGFRDEAGLIGFNSKNHVPAIGFSLDRAGFDFAFNWTGKTDAARADFAQMQLVACETETALRVDERIKERLAFESWIAGFFACLDAAKEIVERLIAAAQNVLKHLAVDGGNVRADGFDVGKLRSLIVVVDRDMADCVGVTPFLKAGIVQLTAKIESLFAVGFKCVVHFEFVLVRLHGTDYTWFLWQNKPFRPFIIVFIA